MFLDARILFLETEKVFLDANLQFLEMTGFLAKIFPTSKKHLLVAKSSNAVFF